MIGEGVSEHIRESFSEAQIRNILKQAFNSVIPLCKSGILHCLSYYKNFIMFIKTKDMTLKFKEFISIKKADQDNHHNEEWLDMEVVEYYLRLIIPRIKPKLNLKQNIKLMSLRNSY